MLLTIAFVCFLAQVVCWIILPASARPTESAYEVGAEMDAPETAAA